jgi:DNA-binding response OmpR family regulator
VAGLGQLLVLFLTTRDGVDDRITTLTAGGDDFRTSPSAWRVTGTRS